jgi:SAM-dependent methyltransferase
MKKITWFLALVVMVAACNRNKERPGGYQGYEGSNNRILDKPNSSNGGFDDLVADYESKDRLIWQKPEMVIERLGNLAEKTVVDIGAGTGFFALRLVPVAKHVIATEIDQRFINFMDSAKVELPANIRSRFETRLVEPDDSKLRPGEANAAIIVNTYMYIGNRVDYMKQLRRGIAKGGMVLIVEYKEKNIPVGPPTSIKIPLSTTEKELKMAGFKNIIADDTSLDYQYIVTAVNE